MKVYLKAVSFSQKHQPGVTQVFSVLFILLAAQCLEPLLINWSCLYRPGSMYGWHATRLETDALECMHLPVWQEVLQLLI